MEAACGRNFMARGSTHRFATATCSSPRLTAPLAQQRILSTPIFKHLFIPPRSNLQLFDASSNSLTGSLPANLGSPARLHTLRLASNQLTGRLPGSFPFDAEGLYELDLTGNELAPGDALPQWLGLDG